MTEDFKHAMIDSIVVSAEDKYGHHLNKNYDWMDDYMVWPNKLFLLPLTFKNDYNNSLTDGYYNDNGN